MTTKVFIGGSRKLSRLNDAVLARLDSIIEKKHMVLIGDASGADKAVQQHFAARDYRHLVVYCVNDACRNNVGGWPTKHIPRSDTKKSFEYYAAKDREMAAEASCGFMLWDGESRGTFSNIRDLVAQHKTVLVHLSITEMFYTLRNAEDLPRLLEDAERNGQHKPGSAQRKSSQIASPQLDLGFI